MKVALVDEPEIDGDSCDLLSARQPALRFFQPKVAKVAMHRKTVAPLKPPRELKPAHRRDRRELTHGDGSLDVGVQIVPNVVERAIVAACRRFDRGAASQGERAHTTQQQLVGRQ